MNIDLSYEYTDLSHEYTDLTHEYVLESSTNYESSREIYGLAFFRTCTRPK